MRRPNQRYFFFYFYRLRNEAKKKHIIRSFVIQIKMFPHFSSTKKNEQLITNYAKNEGQRQEKKKITSSYFMDEKKKKEILSRDKLSK